MDEEVVADGNLHRGAETVGDEEHVEKSGIEHDVAVVGNEGVTAVAGLLGEDGRIEFAPRTAPLQELVNEGAEKGDLHFEGVAASGGFLLQRLEGHTGEETLGNGTEGGVGQE